MINQGMIQGNSALVYSYRILLAVNTTDKEIGSPNTIDPKSLPKLFLSKNIAKKLESGDLDTTILVDKKLIEITNKIKALNPNLVGQVIDFTRKHLIPIPINVDINFLDGDKLDIEKFKNWREEYKNAEFIKEENGDVIVGREVEKMSKSKYNVQTPDELVEKFGADTLRCYEMFLGPLEQHKPWDTQGITGVHGFLKKLWRLFHTGENESFYVDETPILASADGSPHPSGELEGALKSLHKTIKKVKEDIERFSFNTPVSAFMICVNELTALKCNKRAILEPLLIILAPYAPHIAEELWAKLGNTTSITYAVFPKHNDAYLVESNHKYPVSFNGKMRFMLELPADMSKEAIEKEVLANEQSQKYLEGKIPKKVIVIPQKIVNVVI